LARVLDGAVEELEAALPPPFGAELRTLGGRALADGCTLGEIRVANALLEGWIEGLLDSAVMEIIADGSDAGPSSDP
jgi:hypothetical protein